MGAESKYEKMARPELIKTLKNLANVKDGVLSWEKLCQLTEFDSFATCLAFGFYWKENGDGVLEKMTDNYLRMCIFNILTFPKIKGVDDE